MLKYSRNTFAVSFGVATRAQWCAAPTGKVNSTLSIGFATIKVKPTEIDCNFLFDQIQIKAWGLLLTNCYQYMINIIKYVRQLVLRHSYDAIMNNIYGYVTVIHYKITDGIWQTHTLILYPWHNGLHYSAFWSVLPHYGRKLASWYDPMRYLPFWNHRKPYIKIQSWIITKMIIDNMCTHN